ncbi:MAG: hypothetical protein ACI4DU_04390 [Lachnospiraceae bacterium]
MKFPILTSVIIFVIVLSFAIKRSNRQMEQDSEAFFERERRANTVRKKSLDNLNYIHIPPEILAINIEKICADYFSGHGLEEPVFPSDDASCETPVSPSVEASGETPVSPSVEASCETPVSPSDEASGETVRVETQPSPEYLDFKEKEKNLHNSMQTLHALSKEKIVNFTGISNTDLKLTYGTANISPLMEFDQNYTALAMELQNFATLLLALDAEEAAIPVLEFAIATKSDISSTYKNLASLYKKKNQPEKIEPLIQQARELPTVMSASIVKHLEEISQTEPSSDP